MSGTSLDGVDIAFCEFQKEFGHWQYIIHVACTYEYTSDWEKRLSTLANSTAYEFERTHHEYGRLLGSFVNDFVASNSISADLIASHGHTIFHQPQLGFTTQIGSGADIYATTKIPVICDFRSVDVSLGGQGAPLVPLGDKLLFGEYQFCLNLGGFANITINNESELVAFDIAAANIVLNSLANEVGLAYDNNGDLAKEGQLYQLLLEELNQVNYYGLKSPKSLGREWVDETIFPIINGFDIPLSHKLHTYVVHLAEQISRQSNTVLTRGAKMLVTGGGAHNKFLISKLFEKCSNIDIVVPNKETVDYKEALIFAFLGLLRKNGQFNSLASVTGASNNAIGGAVYGIMP